MVKLTRLDGSEFIVNASLIEAIEANPDTVIKLITGKKFMVKEAPADIVQEAIKYYKDTGGPKLVVYEDHCYRHDEDIA